MSGGYRRGGGPSSAPGGGYAGRAESRRPFRTLVSEHIIATLMSAVAGQSPDKKGNNVLVVDDFALSVINAAVSHNDLLKAGFMSACGAERRGARAHACTAAPG